VLSAAHVHAGSYAACLNVLPNVDFVAVWDNDAERGQNAASVWNVPFQPDLNALLEAVDAVVITAENARHAELTKAAAAANVAVLCEKPLATSKEDGEAMIAACKEAGVPLMTAFPCRFSPVAMRLKETVDSGVIGKILAIKGTNRGKNPGGWFNDVSLAGGGAVMDHTVHVADLIHWITGAKPATVSAEIDNSFYHGDFDDTGNVFIRYEDGMFATIDTSWSRPKSFPTWGDVTLEIIGETGTLYGDLFAQHFTVYSDITNRVDEAFWGDHSDLGLVAAFVAAVENKTPVPITGEDGLAAAKIALAAYRSANSHTASAV
jgi:predicted dehydrogenase